MENAKYILSKEVKLVAKPTLFDASPCVLQVENLKCKDAPGCGTWEPEDIANPDFKGKWRAPLIANPAYKGIWKPRKIPNPDFFEDLHPYKMTSIVSGCLC